MKRYFSKLLAVLLVVGTFSCSEEFLETSPTDAYTPGNALSTPENMMLAINGMHREMYAQSPLDDYQYSHGGECYIMPMMEFGAGDYLFATPGTGWFRETCQWTDHTDPNDGHTEFVWYHYYHIIASANNIINAADGMVETALLNSVLGQAHAYRAFLYHRLVALYGKNPQYSDANTEEGVPLMFETAPPYEGLERSSVAEVYKQCEDDIKAAIAYLAKATTSNNKSYISLAAANGIAARIALSKGDFVNAATYANAARQGFALMSKDEFKSGFNSVDNREWIWGATVVADQTNYFRSWFYYVGMNFNGSFDRGTPRFMNEVLYNQISVTDYRREVILATAPNNVKTWDWTSDDPNDKDPNYATEAEWKAARKEMADTYFGGLSNFKTYPHQCAKFLNENGGTIEPEDVLYMRVAEMYLTEAEALAKQGGKDAAAAQVLYELVSTRDAGYVLSTNTGDALIAEILLQRRIELFGEGHRWFDMLRNNEELDLTGSSADKSFYTKGYKQARPSINHNNWVFQIPQEEINANKKISPNDPADL